jgi:hypothetical protein
MTAVELYHYTCAHSAKGIRRSGKLDPNPHPLLGTFELVWLTDLEHPDMYALGLTSHIIKCRRTEYRVTVDAPDAMRWADLARELRRSGDAALRSGVADLESAVGVRPMHWWVSTVPVRVVQLEAVR